MSLAAAFRPRHAAWIPAALLIAYLIASATGMAITQDSRAASSTTTVSATVEKEVHMALTTCGTVGTTGNAGNNWTWTSTITGPTNLLTTDGVRSLGTCELTFGSNNNGTLGATLSIRNSRAGGTNSFCGSDIAVTADCTGSGRTFTDVGNEDTTTFAVDGAAATGKFGVTYTKDAGCTGGFATGNRHGLPQGTPGTVCSTANTSDSTVTVDYLVNPGTSQTAGAYQVQTIMTALAD